MLCTRNTIGLTLFALAVAPATGQTILYVDDDALLGGDGTTWATAYRHLQDALTEASTNGVETEIRVAWGIYKPDRDEGGNVTPGDRTATFQLLNHVAIYGGYVGLANPDNPDDRDITLYETILIGDLNGDDGPDFANHDENSRHVVTGNDTDATAILDGFTITAGNADGLDSDGDGGGMYSTNGSPTLTHCSFNNNLAVYGAGMMNWTSSPTLTDGTFSGNLSVFSGGGMYNIANSNPVLVDCTFNGNSNPDSSGGAMVNQADSNPALTNCTFKENLSVAGGGIVNIESSPVLTNCTFRDNSAADGGGMYNYINCNPILIDCTFTGNPASNAGGGMVNWESSPTLTNCIFDKNSAGNGGGMYNYLDSNPTLTNCTVGSNLASYTGGGNVQ